MNPLARNTSQRFTAKASATHFGKKRSFIIAVTILLIFSLQALGLKWSDYVPSENGYNLLKKFLVAGLSPAIDYQSSDMPADAPPYYMKVVGSLWLTLQYAVCAMSIAIVVGISLGFFSSKSWWPQAGTSRLLRYSLAALHRIVRTVITFGRSIHELLWALLFISAFGTSPFAAIMALAIPFGCTLAKVFSEIIDEQDRSNSNVIRAHGASSLSTWLFGIIPSALPDLISYALYRFECAVRSAAILGFVGIATIGYHIQTAFADGHYQEIWTLLYSLLILLILIESLSSYVRAKISTPLQPRLSQKSVITDTDHVSDKITYLKKQYGHKLSLYIIATGIAALILTAWNTGEAMFSDLSSEQRATNLERFINDEIKPYPVQQSGNWADALPWAKNLLFDKGLEATVRTLYIATSAIIIAFLAGLISIPFGSQRLNQSQYEGISLGLSKLSKFIYKLGHYFTKTAFLITRSMPEYLLAYLLLQIFGPTAWPLILGLALHNFGIIGRLGGEVIDNSDGSNAKVVISQGGSRNQLYLFTLLPTAFNRLVLYFFYRWETCIRDATVMGMLGISSLGFLIDDASARDNSDEMLFYILLGACLVMIGDIISDITRSKLRAA